ncbi:MAG: ribbon-helix-helix protein, CopG family [Promethearchaeota archaeon]|nr:MAG: ribbon-helix-helix protein, CopG family [Candidatus Lokiarchaeota archaeon]
MPSETKKSSDLSRITFSLDAFDERVINLMAQKRKQSRSETVRSLIHNWIENNPNLLKSNYDIDLNDITREIEITDYNQVIQDSIQKLIKYSELFNEIEFDILAEQLEISKKILRDIIFEHKNKLEKLGIKLRIRGNLIIKE